MIEGNCERCQWPIVPEGKEGCHLGKTGVGGDCGCSCVQYPACPCGTFDREHPDIPMTVPRGTIVPTAAAVMVTPSAPPERYQPAADTPTMVILHQVDNGKASIVFIGKDKAKAFDAMMAFDKTAVLSEFSVEEEK